VSKRVAILTSPQLLRVRKLILPYLATSTATTDYYSKSLFLYLLIQRTILSSKAAPYYTAQGVKNLKIVKGLSKRLIT